LSRVVRKICMRFAAASLVDRFIRHPFRVVIHWYWRISEQKNPKKRIINNKEETGLRRAWLNICRRQPISVSVLPAAVYKGNQIVAAVFFTISFYVSYFTYQTRRRLQRRRRVESNCRKKRRLIPFGDSWRSNSLLVEYNLM